jgi:hypothetical protein
MAGVEYHLTLPTPEEATEGTQAITEASALAAGVDLSDRAKINQLNQLWRTDRVDTHVHRILVCGIWMVAAAAFLMFAAIVANKLLPMERRFLGEKELREIYEFLFTGGMGGVVTEAARKMIKK